MAQILHISLPNTDFFGDLGNVIGDIPVISAIGNAISNPDLLAVWLELAAGLSQTKVHFPATLGLAFPHPSLLQTALNSIISEATGVNAVVGTTAQTALDSVTKAQNAVDSIGEDLLLAKTPSKTKYAPPLPVTSST